MKYDINRNPLLDPSLKEMTEVAVSMLSRNPQGFYLFVEGEWLCLQGKSQGQGSRANSSISPTTGFLQGVVLTKATMRAQLTWH